MKKSICITAATLAMLLGGCAVKTDILPAATSESGFKDAFYEGTVIPHSDNTEGLEEFRVFHQGATGFVPQTKLLNTASARAKEFCAKRGMDMRIITEQRASGAKVFGNFPRIELVFVCPPKTEKPAGSKSESDMYRKLVELKDLLDKGIITAAEFAEQKKKVLSTE